MIAAEGGALAQAGTVLRALHGLQPEDLEEGFVAPIDDPTAVLGIPGATVFLFHGAYQDFDAEDLAVLDRAMRAARVLSQSIGLDAMARRLQFAPVAPAGPAAVDAALQGYRLARMVRSRLGWGAAPLGDMRALVEVQLGIPVLVDELVTTDLRAASIVDEARCAAAAVLSANDQALQENHLLARVYLAHELCHVLFDPSAPGCVHVALDDDRPYERVARSSALPPTALLESRAKAFAAELLMPLDGLQERVGAPAQVDGAGKGESLVRQMRDWFGTPWEITVYHLRNHGFIRGSVVPMILRPRKVPPLERSHTTSLPDPGAAPRALEHAALAAKLSLQATRDEPTPAHAPAYVSAARARAREAQRQSVDEAVALAVRASAEARSLEATDIVVERLDDLLHEGAFDEVGRMLGLIAQSDLPASALTGALMVTRPAKNDIGESRDRFAMHVETVLATRWGRTKEHAQATVERRR